MRTGDELVNVYILDLLVIGVLLLIVTLGSGWIARLPLSYALIYLIVGIVLSPYGFNLIQVRPEAEFLERVAELVVLISLFSCGLKMNRPMRFFAWRSTTRLIGLLMPITIFSVAAIAHFILKLDWGLSILLGAILAPTDPVLASEVQLYDSRDRDELRFGITSEGGLNDALAFPFVYFGIHWIEKGNWQNWFREWVLVDVIWAIAAGLAVGFVIAKGIKLVDKRLEPFRTPDDLMEDFVALSTIFIAYAVTEVVNGYGFLAVFVAGMAMRRRRNSEYTRNQLHFIERLEKLAEIGTILLLGSMLRFQPMFAFAGDAFVIALSLIFVIRPIGAWISTIGLNVNPATRWLYGWFGIRGVGSIYYLAYAFGNGLKGEDGEQIAWITFWTIVISVLLHGITSTPLMQWYERNIEHNREIEPKAAQHEEQGT
ncbi:MULTISPECIES: cation:proton antiporter [Leptolyngbya]|uniref:cation:proton antiporter n=1 Tax=Leptolyngbya TaxID=47251 RepID=UPI001685BEEF|nr:MULTISPECIES: sodium:proton antiporter [unclassified Leptolyngbya]MBD1858286.1 sodium:proton antiporter [Leptolyngbya sp. FACHB-1624]MCY6494486.1 sodium:proton antiporter [Leptolyngbya sp. GGD]